MPSPSTRSSSEKETRINNNRLCPQSSDILKQVQTLRRQSGRGKIPLRALNDEAIVKYFADEIACAVPKPSSRKSAA